MIQYSIICLLAFSAPVFAVPVFIGTQTGPNSESKGIYRAEFDPASGRLGVPELAAEYKNPGFLAEHPGKPVLYAVGAPASPFADGRGSVAAFAIGAGHSLELLGEASSGGVNPCHLAVDKGGRVVAVANYSDGAIALVALDDKGVPGALLDRVVNPGSGPNPKRQESTHAHGVYFGSKDAHLFVPDLGLDQVLVYQTGGGVFDLKRPLAPLRTAPGAGPRHMAFSPDERHAYVINELDNTVLAAAWGNGKFEPIGTVPTLPEDFTKPSTTAEIEVSADGRFVYASNRGHDSIVVYRRDPQNGTLEWVQHAPCGGRTPRHFKISPCGKWLLCGHQASHTISVLARDPETGKLGAPAQTVATPSPICILFPR
jgi:6-phosphogluconolactonase